MRNWIMQDIRSKNNASIPRHVKSDRQRTISDFSELLSMVHRASVCSHANCAFTLNPAGVFRKATFFLVKYIILSSSENDFWISHVYTEGEKNKSPLRKSCLNGTLGLCCLANKNKNIMENPISKPINIKLWTNDIQILFRSIFVRCEVIVSFELFFGTWSQLKSSTTSARKWVCHIQNLIKLIGIYWS